MMKAFGKLMGHIAQIIPQNPAVPNQRHVHQIERIHKFIKMMIGDIKHSHDHHYDQVRSLWPWCISSPLLTFTREETPDLSVWIIAGAFSHSMKEILFIEVRTA